MHHRLLHTEGSHSRAVIFLYLLTACFCSISVYFAILDSLLSAAALLTIVLILTVRLLLNLGVFSEWTDGAESTPTPTASGRKD